MLSRFQDSGLSYIECSRYTILKVKEFWIKEKSLFINFSLLSLAYRVRYLIYVINPNIMGVVSKDYNIKIMDIIILYSFGSSAKDFKIRLS